MRFRDTLALTFPSLILRVVLGVTFIWAGLGKLMTEMEVGGERAAVLAELGVIKPVTPGVPDRERERPEVPPDEPTLDEPGDEDAPAQPEGADDPTGDDGAVEDGAENGLAWSGGVYVLREVRAGGNERRYTASDFPEPLSVRRVHGLTLVVYYAARPGFDDEGSPKMALLPEALGEAPWPVALAWAAALTEVFGGFFLLVGFLTRLSALGVFGVMAGAAWFTEIGPAVQTGDVVLGFLPAHGAFDTDAWKTLLWQFALLGASLAVVFLGSGALGLDRAIFRRPRDDEDYEPSRSDERTP